MGIVYPCCFMEKRKKKSKDNSVIKCIYFHNSISYVVLVSLLHSQYFSVFRLCSKEQYKQLGMGNSIQRD